MRIGTTEHNIIFNDRHITALALKYMRAPFIVAALAAVGIFANQALFGSETLQRILGFIFAVMMSGIVGIVCVTRAHRQLSNAYFRLK